jgi:hypothetical protein
LRSSIGRVIFFTILPVRHHFRNKRLNLLSTKV